MSDKMYVYSVVNDVKKFVEQLFDTTCTKDQILNWAIKRRQNRINEDFLDNAEIEL